MFNCFVENLKRNSHYNALGESQENVIRNFGYRLKSYFLQELSGSYKKTKNNITYRRSCPVILGVVKVFERQVVNNYIRMEI